MKTPKLVLLGAAVVAFALIAWWFILGHQGTQTSAESSGRTEAAATGPKVLYWYDPMYPEQHFDKPGKSPYMDMDLLPKYASGEQSGDSTIVEVDPRMVQNLGIRTAKVTRGEVVHSFDAVGAVEVDEHRIYAVESRAEGWVERLSVRAVGESVRQGQMLAGVYSPELYSAQAELVLAVKAGGPELIAASRQRLMLLGMSEAQIAQVQATGQAQRQVAIVSPHNGAILELNVREGQKVMPGTPLMRIADLSRVWLSVEVPESLSNAIAPGRRAEVHFAALSGKRFEGRVDYVYPSLDAGTRTLRARITFDNPDGSLKPGMYGRVIIDADAAPAVLKVPSEAVIRTGKRTVVIVAEGGGHFRPAEVSIGPEHDGETVILDGLEEGQSVVSSGQFLIDAEASLRGAYKRMEGEAPLGGMEGMPMPPSEKKP